MNWEKFLIDYQHYLKIERGLSKNSIDSYGNDIKKLIKYIHENDLKSSPKNIDDNTIQQFIYQSSK
ncbi:MAG: site-specific integrase, partial [Flavobacteriaceae bacterium]|nr:site-specific integrase [Flavobacteriaceae bacterium]